jgi:hypothetical protein
MLLNTFCTFLKKDYFEFSFLTTFRLGIGSSLTSRAPLEVVIFIASSVEEVWAKEKEAKQLKYKIITINDQERSYPHILTLNKFIKILNDLLLISRSFQYFLQKARYMMSYFS